MGAQPASRAPGAHRLFHHLCLPLGRHLRPTRRAGCGAPRHSRTARCGNGRNAFAGLLARLLRQAGRRHARASAQAQSSCPPPHKKSGPESGTPFETCYTAPHAPPPAPLGPLLAPTPAQCARIRCAVRAIPRVLSFAVGWAPGPPTPAMQPPSRAFYILAVEGRTGQINFRT